MQSLWENLGLGAEKYIFLLHIFKKMFFPMSWRKRPITSPSSQSRSLFFLKEANLAITNKNFQAVLTRFHVGGFTGPRALLSVCGRVTALLSLDSSSRLFHEF